MAHNQTLQLQNKKPLCYLIQHTSLLQSLPYIDDDVSDIKSKVIYLIKSQQKQRMSQINPFQYIQSLKLPQTPFLNSERFNKQFERVKNKLTGQKDDSGNVNKRKQKNNRQKTLPVQIDRQKLSKSKVTLQTLKQYSQKINQNQANYEQSIVKNINVQLSKQFSPLIMKQLVQSLQLQKHILNDKIQKQKQQISEINRLRKYEQLETRERQQTIEERIKVMVNKRRKLQ